MTFHDLATVLCVPMRSRRNTTTARNGRGPLLDDRPMYFLDERGVPMLDLPFWPVLPFRLAWAEVAELEQLLGRATEPVLALYGFPCAVE